MDFINIYGIIIFAAIMIPNIVFAATHKDGFENKYQNKAVELSEQIGRYSCFALMIFNIPYAYNGYWFAHGETVYLIGNGLFVFFYCLFWIIYWKKDGLAKAIILSVLPSCMFIFSGVMTMYIPLIAAGIIFAICHIKISCMNALLK
jgi:hypothetical protein